MPIEFYIFAFAIGFFLPELIAGFWIALGYLMGHR